MNKSESESCICICEHWCREEELKYIHINNYSVGSYYCRQNLRCGGVSIFVRNGLQFKRKPDFENLSIERSLELGAIEIADVVTCE